MISKSDKRKPTWQLIVTEVKFPDVGEVVKRLWRHERQPVRRNVKGLEAEDFRMCGSFNISSSMTMSSGQIDCAKTGVRYLGNWKEGKGVRPALAMARCWRCPRTP